MHQSAKVAPRLLSLKLIVSKTGNVEIANKLLENGANLNLKDNKKETAIMKGLIDFKLIISTRHNI